MRGQSHIFAVRSPKAIYLLPGEHGKFWGDYRDGVEKSGVLEHKSGISLKRVKIDETLGG